MSASTTRARLDAVLDGFSFPADRDALVEAAHAADDETTSRPPARCGRCRRWTTAAPTTWWRRSPSSRTTIPPRPRSAGAS